MTSVTEDAARAALRGLPAPGLAQDMDALGVVESLAVVPAAAGATVTLVLNVGGVAPDAREGLQNAIEKRLGALPGVAAVRVVQTARKEAAAPPRKAPLTPPGVRHVVAVASGKGGVGKSTVAANLAVALAGNGLRVGLLDADVYGPSQPRMMGATEKPETDSSDKMIPLRRHGVALMSIGLLVPEEMPIVWRGPMVHGALQQLFRDVAWGELDVLVVDLPPGTGDAQLTMAQQVSLAGAVIVSTPQDIALLDARRAIGMFHKVSVPILGIVENMSGFACPHCGARTDLFGHGGARQEAERLGVPFLGEIPLESAVRAAGDEGAPLAARAPESPAGQAFLALARAVRERLG